MELLKLRENSGLAAEAAVWFHDKWQSPLEEYTESIQECLNGGCVPQWYVVVENERIIGGAGVIENDFHDRKDLTPNVCAVYVEKEYRCRGIAGKLLAFLCEDMRSFGLKTLYLVTDHTGFYENYGWKFLCRVTCEGEPNVMRMYFCEL